MREGVHGCGKSILAVAIAGGAMLILPRQSFQLGGAIFSLFRRKPESIAARRFRLAPE